MIDLGTVRPGSTIRIPFSSFDKDDGSSITMTNYAAADILVYKDGSTTERASTAGFTATTDFDSKTGKHLAVIDLADNTTAGFWAAGSEYLVAIDAVTVDAVTTGGWIGRFRIGYPNALLDTTIATLTNQTSFTLAAGPAENDALNGCIVAIHDAASAVQVGFGVVSDYTGASKTVTLTAGTTFTAAATDNISFFPPVNVTHIGATAQTANDNGADINEILTDTGTTLQGELDGIQADTEDIQSRLPAALVSGRIDASVGAMAANVMTAAAAAADLTTELQSGLATSAALATVDTVVDAIKAVTDLLPDAGALSSLATQASVNTIDDFLDTEMAAVLAAVDTEVAAIKAKTDQLTFTTAGIVDANVQQINDVTITGDGQVGTEFGV